jgi:acid stress chaperone HdeB
MKKTLIFSIVLVLLSAASSAAAGGKAKSQVQNYGSVDMATVTCNDMLQEKDQQTVAAVLIWVDGYLSGKTSDTRVDINQLKNLAVQLEGHCRANPSSTIMQAVKQKAGKAKY